MQVPIRKDLVLLGGGHSHAIALKQFGMNPVAGVQLTLITDVSHTPYSGMLPGYVAGLYDFDACHIDLRPLTQFAQVRMIVDQAIGFNDVTHEVLLQDHPPIAFDLLSIDIGSNPAAITVPGAAEYAIAVKPISQFLTRWDQLVAETTQNPERSIKVAIVGGGAGGVELAFNIQARLLRILSQAGQPTSHLELHLFHRGDRLLPERHLGVSRQVQKLLAQRGVHIHLQQSVTEIKAASVHCESGLTVACDRIFWVTQAAAAPWLKASGLATDERGFILVNDQLQSISHPQIFAAGDVATMVHQARPKAGVFAVRQGKPLAENLRRAVQIPQGSLLSQPLKSFVPQKDFLILLGTGDRRALASWGAVRLPLHPWLWRWKDGIDQKFMDQFRNLTMESRENQPSVEMPMHCAGCASKVGGAVLGKVLARLGSGRVERDDVLVGLAPTDDAAVVTVPLGKVMVQTVDHFRALVNDPFLFGQICANHCLSDLFAMGAMPQSALAIATLPYASELKQEEMLYQLLSGTLKVLNQSQAMLIGGHTTEGAELSLGLSCNGLADPEKIWRKSDMKPGQVLILTKALGTGTLFAADMRLQAKGRWIEAAIASMLLSNQGAAECLRTHGVTACTDVTGFGLLGHLVEMVRASNVAVELQIDAIAVLPGAYETIQKGILSSLHPQNLQVASCIHNLGQIECHPLYPLLFDPQTSGGLLATVPAEQAIVCLKALHSAGYTESRVVGKVIPLSDFPPVTFTLS
ncbi:MAG: selenide, water dikinase SelD [Timaviella obliquedivisa GSE-PSE-MK23-08B]|jgi:selenide,water dikinase|nr:selenide, water dikinase SelD [Timaviella obliquedivisa GSE-PSE-MK23-08B]